MIIALQSHQISYQTFSGKVMVKYNLNKENICKVDLSDDNQLVTETYAKGENRGFAVCENRGCFN